MTTPAVQPDPPFWRAAAKFLVALAAAVVGTSATILAAVDDNHVSGKEWAAIVLGVLALLAGPAAVYGVRNAVKPVPSLLPADFVPEVHFRRHKDGTVDLVWPHGPGTTLITPERLEQIVASHNEATRKAGGDGSAAAQRTFPAPPPTQRSGDWTPPEPTPPEPKP